ncbi:MAG TPA: PorP/SprF family type IX secretion system membrane protein [Daejeonella sp.]|nr:PorP/SprF family type IX secretion system membrane protein [Daejeonella sp.]
MKKTFSLFMVIGLTALCAPVHAQLNPLGSTYYQNEYLYNPAMAGIDNNLKLNAAVRAQWTNIEGAPLSQALTADYGFSTKVGLGLMLHSEQLGVFQRSRAMLSYAYHLPLNDEVSKLNFGLSMGLMHKWIDHAKVIGDDSDENINTFNNRPTSLDFDFGVAYTNEKLTIQGAVPNLPRIFNRDIARNAVDLPLLFSAISYKAELSGLDYIEPKVAFRKVQHFNSIWDIGARFSFSNERLGLDAIYRSTKSLIVGLGTTYKESLSIQVLFTSNPSQMSSHASGEFELALKYSIKKKN